MKKPAWEDATSYSRGERGNKEPTSWQIVIHGVKVFITKAHVYNPGVWSVTCREVGLDVSTICEGDAHCESVQDVALAQVSALLYQKAIELRKASEAMIDARSKL